MSEIELVRLGHPLLLDLEALGYRLEIEKSLTGIKEKIAPIGRLDVTPIMDVDRLDFEIGEAFWVILSKDGLPVASVSAKVINLGPETLGAYIRRTSIGQYGRGRDVIERFDPFLDLLRGRLVYTGQVQTVEKTVGNKNIDRVVLAKFLRFTKLAILANWQFDWVFGFVAEKDIPLNKVYGFSCVCREAVTWTKPCPSGRNDQQALLASTHRQFKLSCF